MTKSKGKRAALKVYKSSLLKLGKRLCHTCKEGKIISEFASQTRDRCRLCVISQKAKCKHTGCAKKPSYGHPSDKRPQYCKPHALTGMISRIVRNTCQNCNCKTAASHGMELDVKPKYCAKHALPGMRNIVSKRCVFPNCKTIPNFGLIGTTAASHCAKHKEDNMMDIRNKSCIKSGCVKRASYGLDTDKIPTYCAEHAADDMRNIVSKVCKMANCNIMPTYGYAYDTSATHCNEHKLNDMIDIKNPVCCHQDCSKQPSYGYTQDLVVICCKDHKFTGMENLRKARCIKDGCTTIPCFGYVDSGKPTHCSTHRLTNMTDLKNRKCIVPSCFTQPTFGFHGDENATHCREHALPEMVDVKHRLCEHGVRKHHCTGDSVTCGRTLKGRSRSEIYQVAFIYTCCCIENSQQANLARVLCNMSFKFTPKNSSWTQRVNGGRFHKFFSVDGKFQYKKAQLIMEYDGMYWHRDHVSLDTVKTQELLSAGFTVLRIRDRLPALDIQHDNYFCVNVNECDGSEMTAKIVWEKFFCKFTEKSETDETWDMLWRTSSAMADQIIEHFLSDIQ